MHIQKTIDGLRVAVLDDEPDVSKMVRFASRHKAGRLDLPWTEPSDRIRAKWEVWAMTRAAIGHDESYNWP